MLNNKVAIVTGGTRGIGKGIAKRFLEEGATVIIIGGKNKDDAEHAVAELRPLGPVEAMMVDLSDADAIEKMVDDVAAKYGRIDVLVNNAGIRRDNLLLWMEDNDWDSVLGTGLEGFFNVTRLLVKPMLVKRHGRIINMASLSGLKGLPGQCNYSAAKGGLIAATKALAQEVGRKGVTVNAVAPGFIRTEMTDGLDEAQLKKTVPLNRFGEPEEVAALVAFLASAESGYITGECISINGGLY